MTQRHRAGGIALLVAGAFALVVAAAATAHADPVDPTVTPVPVPEAAPAPAPADPNTVPPAPITPVHPPEIQNQTYGSGKYGGGILGTLRDLWDQAKNPTLSPDGLMGSAAMPTPPPGAGPAPALPPGYVSTNAPGSETQSAVPAGGPATGRPALPPGYYSIDGPPPPGYEYSTPLFPAPTVTP